MAVDERVRSGDAHQTRLHLRDPYEIGRWPQDLARGHGVDLLVALFSEREAALHLKLDDAFQGRAGGNGMVEYRCATSGRWRTEAGS
jgi:hypothetical protein